MPKPKQTALARAIARAKRSLQTAAQDLREVESLATDTQATSPGTAGSDVARASGSGSTSQRRVAAAA